MEKNDFTSSISAEISANEAINKISNVRWFELHGHKILLG